MGDLIRLSDYRNKRRARKQEKISNIDLSKPPGKKVVPRIKLPPLGEVFVKNLHLRVSDPYALDQFILDLFTEPDLPSLDASDDDTALNTDYKLQALAKDPSANFSLSLYNARTHLEKSLGISMHRLSAVRAHSIDDRVVRALLGMFSIAWQLETGQELVVDASALAARHAKR